MRKIYTKIHHIFIHPHAYVVAIYVASKLIREKKRELRAHPLYWDLSSAEIHLMASSWLTQNFDKATKMTSKIEDEMGYFKYVLPAFFWYYIFSLITS